MLRRFSGATIRSVIDRSNSCVAEYAHDWPVLSIFVMGDYRNETEVGGRLIAGPSAIFYRAGAAHRNWVGSVGFEQIEIEFDAAWLGCAHLPAVPVSHWLGGQIGAEARRLARGCASAIGEKQLRDLLRVFVRRAISHTERKAPNWLPSVQQRLREATSLGAVGLADEVGLHPSWLGTAYRKSTGEGLMETAARCRVERAARALRETNESCAYIASEVGFCDQSHMIRTFRRVLGKSPLTVRADRMAFRALAL